jgi:hypothetical protein
VLLPNGRQFQIQMVVRRGSQPEWAFTGMAGAVVLLIVHNALCTSSQTSCTEIIYYMNRNQCSCCGVGYHWHGSCGTAVDASLRAFCLCLHGATLQTCSQFSLTHCTLATVNTVTWLVLLCITALYAVGAVQLFHTVPCCMILRPLRNQTPSCVCHMPPLPAGLSLHALPCCMILHPLCNQVSSFSCHM